MDLLHFLESSGNSRKLFGERELKIIEKQLNGINLTQSEKNRLSRDIRVKFNFIKSVAKFSDEFELKKGSIVKQLINESKELILEDVMQKHIKKIILFGSAVENELTFRSDIDIAVIFDDITIKDATLFRKRILGKVNSKVDVQVYNILPDKLKKEIDEKGRVIYEDKR